MVRARKKRSLSTFCRRLRRLLPSYATRRPLLSNNARLNDFKHCPTNAEARVREEWLQNESLKRRMMAPTTASFRPMNQMVLDHMRGRNTCTAVDEPNKSTLVTRQSPKVASPKKITAHVVPRPSNLNITDSKFGQITAVITTKTHQ